MGVSADPMGVVRVSTDNAVLVIHFWIVGNPEVGGSFSVVANSASHSVSFEGRDSGLAAQSSAERAKDGPARMVGELETAGSQRDSIKRLGWLASRVFFRAIGAGGARGGLRSRGHTLHRMCDLRHSMQSRSDPSDRVGKLLEGVWSSPCVSTAWAAAQGTGGCLARDVFASD